MADDSARQRYADHCLSVIEALAPATGLGRPSTILFEFEAATMAVIRDGSGSSRVVVGSSSDGPARVLLEARRCIARSEAHTAAGQANGAPGPARARGTDGEAALDPAVLDEPALDAATHDVADFEVGEARLESSGQAVTARVELMHGGRRVVATSTGRNAEERRLYLMAEAAARAVTQFLPPGYGVILGEIQPLPGAYGELLKAAVLFLTPSEDQPLEGTVRVEGNLEAAAARTVLAAVHERVKPLLAQAATGGSRDA